MLHCQEGVGYLKRAVNFMHNVSNSQAFSFLLFSSFLFCQRQAYKLWSITRLSLDVNTKKTIKKYTLTIIIIIIKKILT